MPLIVQKFGGTSVADTTKILAAARKAIRAQQDGNQVIVVVSAMGKNTDLLEKLAFEICEHPPARELDMLLSTGEQVSVALMAMAIHSLGFRAVSLTGAQMGIQTDSSHTKARIRSISTDRIKRLLSDGYIVIAAGFQGIDENLDITTLGRGGSDTTAVALAAVLQADVCEIHTDVDGIYTTDPRLLPEARLTRQVSYDEMLELASLGAGVMHSRSIEFGKKFNVPIHVRSSFTDRPGSFIVDRGEAEDLAVCGATLTKDEARISILDVPDVPGTIYQIFAPIAERAVTVDMIVQNVADDGTAVISFTVPKQELAETLDAVIPAVHAFGGNLTDIDEHVSKVSVVGLGMATQVGVANRMFSALGRQQINMQMITTSQIKISALVSRDQALQALRTVHQEFELDRPITHHDEMDLAYATPQRQVNAVDVIDRLQGVGMESIVIDDISMDDSQSRITLRRVPNRPGVAASIFDRVAEQGIFVDMIVQSHSDEHFADISFTVPKTQFDHCLDVARAISQSFESAPVLHKRSITKLSVSGVGLRSHTGVAIGMFRALGEAAINVDLINTSEVRVNVVVDGSQGTAGLECLRHEFRNAIR